MELLLKWARAQGCGTRKLAICSSLPRAFVASEDVCVGDTLVVIPQRVLLHADCAYRDPEFGRAFSRLKEELHVELDARSVLCLLLIVEKAKQQSSGWAPYISLLPDVYDDPYWWHEDQLQLLRGTRLSRSVAQYMPGLHQLASWMARLYELHRESQLASMDQGVSPVEAATAVTSTDMPAAQRSGRTLLATYESGWCLSLAAARWARSTVWSRSFTVRRLADGTTNAVALVPVLDMIDHSPAMEVVWHTGALGDEPFQYTTLTALKKGTVLVNNYGAKTSDELLLAYGFLLPHWNPTDHFQVSLAHSQLSTTGGPVATAPAAAPAHAPGSRTHKLSATPTGSAPADQQPAALGAPLGALPTPPRAPPPTATRQVSPGAGIPAGFGTALPTVAAPQREAGDEGSDAELARVQLGAEDVQRQLALSAAGLGTQHHLRLHDPLPQGLLLSAQLCLASGSQLYSLTASLTAHMQQQQLPGHGQTLLETQPQLEPSHEEHCCVPAASLTDGQEQVAASSPAANTLSHILMAPSAMHIMASTPTASSHRQHHSGGSHGSSRKRPPPEQNSSSTGMAQQVRVGQPHHRHHRHHRQHHRHEHDPHAQPSGPGPCSPSGPHGPSAAAAAPHHSMGEESGLELQRYREQATPGVAVPGVSDPIHALPPAQPPTPAPPAPGPCHLLEHGLQQQQIPALASLRKQLQGKLDAMASSQELDFAAQCVPTAHTTASMLHPGSSSSTQGSGTASVQAPGYCPSDPVRHKRSGAVAMETDTSCSPLHDLPPPCKPCLPQCQPCPSTAAPTAAGPHSWVLPDLCGLLPGPSKASKELGSPQLACGQVRGQHHHTQLAVQYVRSQQALVRSALTALQHSSSQLVHAASHEVLRCMEATGSHQHILLSSASTPHPTVRIGSTALQGPGSSSAAVAPHQQTSQGQPAAPSPGNAPVPFLCLDPNAHLQQYHAWLAQHGLLAAPSRSHTTSTLPHAFHQTASQQRTLAERPAPSPPGHGSAVSLSARPSTPSGWSAQQPACSPLAAPCALIAEAVCRRSAPRCNTPSHSADSSSCGQDIGQPLANLAPGGQALAPGPDRDSQTGMHSQAEAGSQAGTGSQHAAAQQGPGVAVAAELPAKTQAALSTPGGGGCPRSRAPPSSSRTFRVTKPAPDTSTPSHLAMPRPQQGTGPPSIPPSPPTASASTPTPLGQPAATTPLTRVNLPEGLAVSLGLDSKHDPLAWGATLVQDCPAGAILLQVPQACCLAAPSRPALVQQLMAAAHVLLESLVPAVWAKARGGQGGRGGAGADGSRLAAVQVRPSSQVDMLVWHLMHCVAAGPAARLSGAEAEGVQLLADMLEDSPAGSAYQGIVDGLTTEFLELRTQLSASTASSSGLSSLALAALRRVLARPSAFALFCWAHHAVQQCAVSVATSTAPGSADTWLVPGPSQQPDPPTQLHPAKYYHPKHDSRQDYDVHHQQQQQGVQKLDQSQQEQLPQELWVLAPVLAAVPCLLRDATLSWRVNRHPTHPGFLLEVQAACSLHAGLMLSPLLLLHQQDWEEQMLQHGPEALAWSALLAAGRSASRPPSTQPPACPPQKQHPASTPSSCSSLEQPASIVPAAAASASADLSSSKASGAAPSQMHQPSETQLQPQVLEAVQQAPGLPGTAQALSAQVLYELYICPEEQDRLCKAKLALLAAAGLGCSHHLTCDLSTEPLVSAALKVCLATKSLLSHSLAAQVLEAHAQLHSLAAAQPTDASLSTLGCQGSAQPLLPTPSTPPSQQASAQLASDPAPLPPTQHQGQAPPSCTREQAAQRLASLQAQLVRMLADLPQDHPACRAARKQLRTMVHEARKNTRRRLRQLEVVHTHVTPGAHALAAATSGLDLGGCYSPLGGSTALHQGVLLYLQGLVEVLDEWAEHLGLNRQSDSMSKRSRH